MCFFLCRTSFIHYIISVCMSQSISYNMVYVPMLLFTNKCVWRRAHAHTIKNNINAAFYELWTKGINLCTIFIFSRKNLLMRVHRLDWESKNHKIFHSIIFPIFFSIQFVSKKSFMGYKWCDRGMRKPIYFNHGKNIQRKSEFNSITCCNWWPVL